LEAIMGLRVRTPQVRAGQTDYTLLCAALAEIKMDDLLNEETFALISECACDYYREHEHEELSRYVPAGIWGVLARLREVVTLIPCSGAITGIARTRIERAGLDAPLRVGLGSFAVYGSTRYQLVEVARVNAGSPQWPWPLERLVVISSCAENLVAAGMTGARTLAVGCPAALASASVDEFEQVPHVLAHWL
jgi:hypothetical protein